MLGAIADIAARPITKFVDKTWVANAYYNKWQMVAREARYLGDDVWYASRELRRQMRQMDRFSDFTEEMLKRSPRKAIRETIKRSERRVTAPTCPEGRGKCTNVTVTVVD